MASDQSSSKPLHTAFTANNIKIVVPITLDLKDDEYALWVYLFQLHLKAQNLMFIVEGTESPSRIDGATLKQLDALVQQWMFATMSKDLMLTVHKSGNTAKAIWDHLKTLFQDNKGTGAATLEKNSLTTSVGGLASAPPARSPADESEMKRIHDDIERYIRRSFDTRKFSEVMDIIENGKGIFEDNVRAVIQAKIDRRNRGQTHIDDMITEWYAEELHSSPLLTEIGLTCGDIFYIECYLNNEALGDVTYDTCYREVKAKSLLGAYFCALSLPGGGSTITFLERMNEAGVPLDTLAILATVTSYLDVPNLRAPSPPAPLG